MAAPVVHRRSTGRDARSVRERPDEERRLLDEHGERIVLYELRGNLFFATADRLFGEIVDELRRPIWLILHMRRVQQVDLTGIKILEQIASRLHRNGGRLLFCNVHREAGLGHNVKKTLRKISPAARGKRVRTFNGTDEALEFAENALLDSLGHSASRHRGRVALADADICAGMSPTHIASLRAAFESLDLVRDAVLFEQGQVGTELYFVERGRIDIRLATTAHHYKRLAQYAAGTTFGEIGFLQPGPRAGQAVAARDSTLLVLRREAFDTLSKEDPETAIALLGALAKRQGQHLRWSAREIQRLAQW